MVAGVDGKKKYEKYGSLMFPASVVPFEHLKETPFQLVPFAPPPVVSGAKECEEVALGGRWGWFFSGTPSHMARRRLSCAERNRRNQRSIWVNDNDLNQRPHYR